MWKIWVTSALLVVVVMGCYCKRCQGQEAATSTVVISATDVADWKTSVFNGLNRLTGDPYNAVCNIFLAQAFGLTTIPSGTATTTMNAVQYQRMQAIKQAINVALGVAIINQATMLEDNRAAIDAAIESATATITNEKARRNFLIKARALRKE